MTEYLIDVGRVEELQTLRDLEALERLFARAKSTIVNGERVLLARKKAGQPAEPFEEFTTLEDLETYRKRVFMYL